MKTHRSLPLFFGIIALTAIWFSFSRVEKESDEVATTEVAGRRFPEEPSPPSQRLTEISLCQKALSKLDPILLEQIESLSESGSEEPISAMIVLSIEDRDIQQMRAAFGSELETSPSHSRHDQSPSRGHTLIQLEKAHGKRQSALQKQRRIINSVVERFLEEQSLLTADNLRHRLRLAPMVEITATKEQLVALAELDSIRLLGGNTPGASAGERTAAQARFSTAWKVDSLDGSGVNLAILEEFDTPFSHLLGPGKPIKAPVAIYDPDNVTDHEHSSSVAGVLWGQDPMFKGLAPGSNPYFATSATTTGQAAATDWCIQQGCSIISMSWGSPAGSNDGNLKWFDLYYDWVTEINRVLIVSAAGNDGNEAGRVIHPGAAYNVLTVGALDGKDPNTWGDDVIAGFSSYVDPNTGTMKPEVVSYGTNIKVASPAPAFREVSSGTSFATPVVAAAAALCVQENPNSADEPMLLKAQLMASAVSHDFSGTEKDGVGTVMAQAYNAATSARTIYRNNNDNLEWTIQLKGGETNRIVLCYPHRPKGSAVPDATTAVDNGNSYHLIDLDLEVFVEGNRIAFSDFGPENPFEVLDYLPSSDTIATVRVAKWNWPASDPRDTLRIGLAHGSPSNFGTGPDDSNDDSFEPNDAPASPAAIGTHETLSEMRSTDEDWFRMTVPPFTTTTARIDFEHDTGDLELVAIRADNQAIEMRSESSDDFETVEISTGSEEQEWLLGIYSYLPDKDRNAYSLTIRSDLPPGAPVPESPSADEQTTTTPTLKCRISSAASNDTDVDPIVSAQWQIATTGDFSSTLLDWEGSDLTSRPVPDAVLNGESTYFFRVRHIDAEGRKSEWSSPIRFSTVTTPGFSSTIPDGLVESWENGTLTLRWDAVAFAGGYRLYSENPSETSEATLVREVNSPEVQFENLLAGHSTEYWITPLNGPVEGTPARIPFSVPPPKVDGLIGKRISRMIGNDRYSSSGFNQKTAIRLSRNGRGRFYFGTQNDSLISDQFSLRMTRGSHKMNVQVRSLTGPAGNITSAITKSTYRQPLSRASTTSYFLVKLQSRFQRSRKTFRVIQTSASLAESPAGVRIDATISKVRTR